jgi:hypothetical protein
MEVSMHHPVAILFWLIVTAFLVAMMATKRPHRLWMKVGITILFLGCGLWSVYGMAQRNENVAIFFGVALGPTVVWRTIKGWPEWWRQL